MSNEEIKRLIKFNLALDPRFEEMLQERHIYGRFVVVVTKYYNQYNVHDSVLTDNIKSVFEQTRRSDIPLYTVNTFIWSIRSHFSKDIDMYRNSIYKPAKKPIRFEDYF